MPPRARPQPEHWAARAKASTMVCAVSVSHRDRSSRRSACGMPVSGAIRYEEWCVRVLGGRWPGCPLDHSIARASSSWLWRSSPSSCSRAGGSRASCWWLGGRGFVKQGAGLDRRALAVLGGDKPSADSLRAVDKRVDRWQLRVGEVTQDVAERGIAVLNEGSDLVKLHSGTLRDADDGQATQDSVVVASLTADPVGCWQKPDPLVVADPRARHTRQLGYFPDSHLWSGR